jgi:hypothetical protein
MCVTTKYVELLMVDSSCSCSQITDWDSSLSASSAEGTQADSEQIADKITEAKVLFIGVLRSVWAAT